MGNTSCDQSTDSFGETSASTSGSMMYTPVFTVSENTCPQVGFSRNRWIRPSSSAITIPNSSGSGTRVSPTVTRAPFSLWNRHISVRSMSVSASPEMTRKGLSLSASSAFFTLPAVPSGISSVAYCRNMPTSSPSPK